MTTPLVIYEDSAWPRLLPLVYMRGVFQLNCGTQSLLARLLHVAGGRKVGLWCRPALAEMVAQQTQLQVNQNASVADGGRLVLLNGRGRWRGLPEFSNGDESWVGVAGADEQVACICCDAKLAARLQPSVLLDEARTRAELARLPRRNVSSLVELFSWPWELIAANEAAIVDDWQDQLAPQARLTGEVYPGSHLLNRQSIHLGAGATVKPCVVVDAEEGPVWIGDHTTILPHSYIQGPAYIGDGCLIQPGAVVHAGTTIGPVCKVGGEVEGSIIHSYSNKQHDGFLGHSYVGSWVNIAADCINSDLKNTYGTVRVPINGRSVETGAMFVGMFVGDYSKSGINVSFPTGSVIGFCSSVFASRSPKFVPSFAWINDGELERYDEERGLSIARKVMHRRKKVMTESEEAAFRRVRIQALALEHQPQRKIESLIG